MRRTTGFHADKAWLDLRKEPVHFRARQLALHGRRAFARQGVDLKIVLGEINANSDKFSHGRSPSLLRSSGPRFGTLMPLRRGRPHHQIFASDLGRPTQRNKESASTNRLTLLLGCEKHLLATEKSVSADTWFDCCELGKVEASPANVVTYT